MEWILAPAPSGTPLAFTTNLARVTATASVMRRSGESNKARGLGNLRPPPPPNSAPVVSSVTTSLPETIATDRSQAMDQPGSELQVKLHRSILAVVQKLQKKEMIFTSGEFGFIRDDGKAELQVWLADKSDETLAQ